jgi:hypothetical protein
LKKRWNVEVMYADEWCGGARDEDADLVDGIVCAVERAVLGERRRSKREEEGWSDALVDGILCDVDKEEG